MKGNKNKPALQDSPLVNGTLDTPAETVNAKEVQPSRNNKKNKNAEKKENFFVRTGKRIGRAFSGMWKELKNVTWPTFGKALASTGIVLVVVVLFFAILLAFDSGLGALFDLIINM